MHDLLLEARDVHAGYGKMVVLHGVALEVHAGRIVAVLGANGAGKTTLLRTLAGVLRPSAGSIRFGGAGITEMSLEQRVRSGIVLVPERRALFPTLTVRENLRMGAFVHRPHRSRLAAAYDETLEYFPALRPCLEMRAAQLSGGQGQMLALGRALMARPRLLLLDEPSQGLAPQATTQVFTILERLVRERGLSVILVEQSTGQALKVASYGYVLEHGTSALAGTPPELRRDARIQRLYLGG